MWIITMKLFILRKSKVAGLPERIGPFSISYGI